MMELYRHTGKWKMRQNRAGEVEYLTFPLLEQTGIPESEYEDQVVHTVIRTACEQLGIYYERRKRR